VRGIYDGSSWKSQAALGFDTFDCGPYADHLEELAALGLSGWVYLGGMSDSEIRSKVPGVAGLPAFYYMVDEPNAPGWTQADVDRLAERSALVHELDPAARTAAVLQEWDGVGMRRYRPWRGKVDVFGIDVYPYTHDGDHLANIGRAARKMDRLGMPYFAVIQGHGDDYYRQPSPAEMHAEFEAWRATNAEGYLVFAWEWPKDRPDLWLANNAPLLEQLKQENAL
jgi:hypothetical protein